jgi:hypothetical protein
VKYDYGQFSPEHLEKMQEGVELFNEQKYWECHESLEDVWMEDRGDLARNVYWAVIQVAAACIHYRDSKIVGAQGMIVKAKEKFLRCREKLILTPLAFDYLDWEELDKLVMEIPAKDAKLEDFAKLYEFRFKNYKNILSN